MKKITFVASLALSMMFITCSKDSKTEEKDVCTEKITFVEIKPIIDKNCGTAGCHAVNSGNGGLTTFQDVKNIIENGKMDSRVLSNFPTMPPGGFADPKEKEKIRCWVDDSYPEN